MVGAAVVQAALEGVQVRHMTTADLRFAAATHRTYLPDGFFPSLGPAFMRAYLGTFLDSRVSVALLAERGGEPVGFLVGSFDHGAHVRQTIRRHGARLLILGVLSMLVRPSVGWRFIRTRAARYLRRLRLRTTRPRGGRSGPVPAGGLGHLVVVPGHRGLGIGSALSVEYAHRVATYGVVRAQLTTRAGAAGAGPFYERLGWRSEATFADPDGLEWTRYQLEL